MVRRTVKAWGSDCAGRSTRRAFGGRSRTRRGAGLALAGLFWLTAPAFASEFSAEIRAWSYTLGQCGSLVDSGNPATGGVQTHPFPGHGISLISSAALPGGLDGSFFFQITPQAPNPTGNFAACTASRMEIDDIMIVGPDPTVSVGVSLDLQGGGSSNGLSSIDLEGSLILRGTSPAGSLVSSGLVAQSGIGQLATPPITVRTDEPLTLTATFDMRASLFPGLNLTTAEYGYSLDYVRLPPFPTEIFDLPPGYTVYSIDGGILDNAFVPEPTGSVGLVLGTLLLSLGQRRRGGRASQA